jgi:hypothetical protein
MKTLIALLILFASNCASAHSHKLCRDPGHWNADYTQYENHAGRNGAGVLYINGRVYDIGEYDAKAIDPEEAAWLEKITWRKGVIDSGECWELGFLAAGVAYDQTQSLGAFRRGCIEDGALHLLGRTPSSVELTEYNLVFRVLPHWIAMKRTPLSRSSAKHALVPILFFGASAFNAGRAGAKCGR